MALVATGSALAWGCAAEDGPADRSTASITAAFTDGSTYAAEGAVAVSLDDANLRVVRRLVEPSTGDELDLTVSLPETATADRTGKDELDADAELTLVRSNAKKTVRVRVRLEDFARTDHAVSGRMTVKSVDTASPILAGTIDLEHYAL